MSTEALIDGMLALMDGGVGWCQDALARDASGRLVRVEDPTATQFCVHGAALRVFGWNGSLRPWGSWVCVGALRQEPAWEELRARLYRVLGYEEGALLPVGYWNDQAAHYGEIKAALEAAREDGK